jgi:hypothetical protein
MPLRSVLDIDINDQKFDAFLAKFKQYQAAAKNLPALMPAGGGGGGRAGGGGPGPEERALPFAERLVRAWATMRGHARDVARHVHDIAQRFMTITGAMGALTGLATAGGMLGMGALASSAAGLRRQALGYGTSIGGLLAARTELGRFVNVDQALGTIRGLQMDPTKPGYAGWTSMILHRRPTEQEDPVKLLEETIKGFQSWAGHIGDKRMIGTMGRSLFGETYSDEDITRLLRTSPREVAAQIARTEQMRKKWDVPDATAQAFQDLKTHLEEAGRTIETHLINKLGPLAGPLTKLTDGLTHLATVIIDKFVTQDNIAWLGDKIKQFSDYIGSKDFLDDVKAFCDNVGALARNIVAAVKWIADKTSNLFGKPEGGPSGPSEATPEKPYTDPKNLPGYSWDSKRGWYHTDDPDKPVWWDPFTWHWGDKYWPSPKRHIAYQPNTPNAWTDAKAIPVRPWPLPLPVNVVGFGDWKPGKDAPANDDGRDPNIQNAAFRTPYRPHPTSAALSSAARWVIGRAQSDLGLSPEQAAGLAAVLASESALDPHAVGPGGDLGLAQLTGQRKADFLAWAKRSGRDPWDRGTQWAWIVQELTTGSQREYLAAMKRAHGAREAAEAGAGYEAGRDPRLRAYHHRTDPPLADQFRQLLKPAKPPLHTPPGQKVAVVIHNETGGSMTTATRQLGWA